jgi:hypothetical protein
MTPSPTIPPVISSLSADPDQIKQVLRLHCGGPLHLRAQTEDGRLFGGIFLHQRPFIQAVQAIDVQFKPVAMWTTMNRISLARATAERMGKRKPDTWYRIGTGEGIGNGDIISREQLLIDVDPKPDTKLTPDQLYEHALRVADTIIKDRFGFWGPPVRIASGRGIQLRWRISIPLTTENRSAVGRQIKAVLEKLNERFGDWAVGIDQGVWDAARVAKLPGSVSRKVGWPERMSRILSFPEDWHDRPLTLEHLWAYAPPADEPVVSASYGGPRFDPYAWLAHHFGDPAMPDIALAKPYEHWGNAATRYVLSHCPFYPEGHSGKKRNAGSSTCIIVCADGTPSFVCKHDHCSGHGIKQLLRRWPPPEPIPAEGDITAMENYLKRIREAA